MRITRYTRHSLLALALGVCTPLAAQAGALTDLLVSQVGVTRPQADGGAGSIFKLAKSQMKAKSFGKLAAVVPGMDQYLAAAPVFLPGETAAPAAAGGHAAALGALAGGGATAGALGTLAGGGTTSGALAAASGQAPSATDMLKNAARDKAAQSLGVPAAAPSAGVAGLAAGALAPGMQAAAPGMGTAGLTAAAGSALAGTQLGGSLQAAQALAPAFQQLGMQPGLVTQFLPVVIEYVKSVGGNSSSKLLTGALGM